MNPWEQIFYNVLGGVIVAIIITIWHWAVNSLKARRFRKIFEISVENPFFISYGIVEYGNDEKEWAFSKTGVDARFGNIPKLVSDAHLRGVKYLSESFGKNINITPYLASDEELKDKMDISFCSIGGKNNYKTNDILKHEGNIFFDFDLNGNGAIVGIKEKELKFYSNAEYDHGFIIKIHPKSLQNRTWIAVAGLGVWGTSGAAWFLARNWKDIEKKYGSEPFGLVVRVAGGKDESAQLVYSSNSDKAYQDNFIPRSHKSSVNL